MKCFLMSKICFSFTSPVYHLYQSCAAMKTIMDDTLDYAKIEAGEFQVMCAPNSLRQMVESTVLYCS